MVVRSEMYRPAKKVEEIVEFIQCYGCDPYVVLVDHLQPMVEMMTAKYFIQGYTQEDFNQEARGVLVQSIYEFDPNFKVPFMQYYNMRLSNYLRRLLRAELAQKRMINRQTTSLDKIAEDFGEFSYPSDEEWMNPLNMTIAKENFSHYIDSLSDFELSVFTMYHNGSSADEIASVLEASQNKVQNALYRCRNKMKKKIKNHV